MGTRIASAVMAVVGLFCGLAFLVGGEGLPLPWAIALKVGPTLMMMVWLVMMGVERDNWTILAGIFFSMVCDVAMALDGQVFLTVGIGANMLGLVFYTLYFVGTDHSLDLERFLPGGLVIGVLYFVLFDWLGTFWLPVLVYCILYAVFLWRAAARLGDPAISTTNQYLSYGGSMAMTVSDCLLSLTIFGVIPDKTKYYVVVMILWWTGLVLLMLTAEVRRKSLRAAAPVVAG